LSQALQMLVPGLYLAPKNGAFDYMNCSLQGSRCQDILWLIDGVRINNRLYNSTSPLDTVPAHMVERVEVLYGGQGIFYGTQSVGGVVNVVTKEFSEALDAGASIGFDENDGTHITADIAGSRGGHQFVFYASHDDADGFKPFENEDYQPSGTDRERGWIFVPRAFLPEGMEPEALFGPEGRPAALDALERLVTKAERHFVAAQAYVTAIPRRHVRIRMFCLSAKYDSKPLTSPIIDTTASKRPSNSIPERKCQVTIRSVRVSVKASPYS